MSTGTQRRRSSSCANGACGEVNTTGPRVLVRTSPRPDVVLELDRDVWRAFIGGLKEQP